MELDLHPGGLATERGLVWMGGLDGLSRVGLIAVDPVPLDVHPTSMAASAGVVWAAELATSRLIEVVC